MPAVVRPVTDERDGLVVFLAQQRHVVRVSAYGLTDEEAARTTTASDLSIAGLLAHLARVERSWAAAMTSSVVAPPQAPKPQEQSSMTLVELLADYEHACAATDEVIETVTDLDQAVPVPAGARWASPEVQAWSVRWVLLHLIQETARHAGHADIVRESLDGATALPLMAAVEGWPPRRTISPWEPRRPG